MPTTTTFIWDDANLLAEADGTDTINVIYTNEPQQYGNLISSRISGGTSYHEFDALGSTRQLTDSAGIATDAALYDAWGNVVSRTGLTAAAQLWVGELGYYSDIETGLDWVRRRDVQSDTGRWTSSDPIRADHNVYRYASNRAVSIFDPSGLIILATCTCRCITFRPIRSPTQSRTSQVLRAANPSSFAAACSGFCAGLSNPGQLKYCEVVATAGPPGGILTPPVPTGGCKFVAGQPMVNNTCAFTAFPSEQVYNPTTGSYWCVQCTGSCPGGERCAPAYSRQGVSCGCVPKIPLIDNCLAVDAYPLPSGPDDNLSCPAPYQYFQGLRGQYCVLCGGYCAVSGPESERNVVKTCQPTYSNLIPRDKEEEARTMQCTCKVPTYLIPLPPPPGTTCTPP